jgi:4'-phosphopantetheinyl transferase
MALYPVVMSIPLAEPSLSGGERVQRLSLLARHALALSIEKSGLALAEIEKDEDDVPCPSNGNHWSVSHKPGCVAAVVGRGGAGIDVEEMVPRKRSLFDLTAGQDEWELAGGRSWQAFFRIWTAKEAVLKAIGVGIGGLKSCRVISVPDDRHAMIEHRGRQHLVEQLYHNGHIVSVLKGDNEVEWTLVGGCGGSRGPGSAI